MESQWKNSRSPVLSSPPCDPNFPGPDCGTTLSGEHSARFRTKKAQLLGVTGGPARRAAYPRVMMCPSVKVVCFCLQEAHQPNGRTYLTMKQPVTRQAPADRHRVGRLTGRSERQHSRQMMATLPCDGKGDRALHTTLDPTRRAQQTIFRKSANVCYAGRFRAPGRTGSGTECRRWGAAGGGQPATGREELPPRPAPTCQVRSIPTCQRCSGDARKHPATGGSTSLAHASLRRGCKKHR